jgi:hypothetical protein
MIRWTHFAIVIGILCVFFLLTRRQSQQQQQQVQVVTEKERVVIQTEVPVIVKDPIRVKYEQETDPLLYVDDGMYYTNPETIEGNRLWIEQRPKTNDLEWGLPLYTDRWSGGIYNGSYKTYTS